MLAVVAATVPGAVFMPVGVTENLGIHPKLAEVSRRLTGGLTSRVLARKSGVSYDTVQRILNGDRPKADTLLKFAEGCRFTEEQTAELMEAAGYFFAAVRIDPLPFPKTVESEQRALYTTDAIRDAIEEGGMDGEGFERVRDPDADADEEDLKIRIVAAYDKLPFKIKQAMTEQAEATAAAMYSARRDIIGKKADRLVDTPVDRAPEE